MKKFIIILAVMLCASACAPHDMGLYTCDLKYSLDGHEFTLNVPELRMSDYCRPVAAIQEDGLVISAYPSQFWHESVIVYRGSLPVKVEDFEYHLVRKYKASWWSGRELTEKKK